MTTDVLALYQTVILEHNKHPQNRRPVEGGRRAEGNNPLCGDRLTVSVRLEGNVIADVGFEGLGCAIAVASASLMTVSARGRTVDEADGLRDQVHRLVTAAPEMPVDDLGPLSALAGVRQFPLRVKCATLAWEALHAALHAPDAVVTTE